MGTKVYPDATRLLFTADSGGGAGTNSRAAAERARSSLRQARPAGVDKTEQRCSPNSTRAENTQVPCPLGWNWSALPSNVAPP